MRSKQSVSATTFDCRLSIVAVADLQVGGGDLLRLQIRISLLRILPVIEPDPIGLDDRRLAERLGVEQLRRHVPGNGDHGAQSAGEVRNDSRDCAHGGALSAVDMTAEAGDLDRLPARNELEARDWPVVGLCKRCETVAVVGRDRIPVVRFLIEASGSLREIYAEYGIQRVRDSRNTSTRAARRCDHGSRPARRAPRTPAVA